MFDISKLSLKTTTTAVQLRHPVTDELLFADDEKSKPVTISVYGTASKEYRNAVSAMQNRQIKRGKKLASAEVIKEEGIELLVAVTDTSSNLEYNGKPVTTSAQFRDLYEDAAYSWLREQVDAAVGDTASFLSQ